MKMLCETCGYLDVAHHDGYGFGDRALEGVMFEVTISGNKLVTVDVEPSSREYFSDLNREKWIKAANGSLDDVLKEGEGLICPTDGKEVILLNDDGSDFTPPPPPKKGLKIKVFKGNDIKAYEEFIKD